MSGICALIKEVRAPSLLLGEDTANKIKQKTLALYEPESGLYHTLTLPTPWFWTS